MIPLDDSSGAIGWATGHLKQTVAKPESWSTASVFHFGFLLRSLVAETIRQCIFDRMESATCSRSCRKGQSSSTRSDSSTATSRSSTARCR